MKKLLTSSALLLLTALCASAATEENIHETRAAKPGGTLVVEVDFGSIEVIPGENDKVVLDAHRKIQASSKEKEQEYFAAAPITITTEGDKVIVRAIANMNRSAGSSGKCSGRTRTEAHYKLRVPANFETDLETSGGNISVSGLTGNLKADTSGGDLNFTGIQGEIHGDTSGGDIVAKDCNGATTLDTSGGRIEVTGGRGKLSVDTSGGNVTVLNRVGDTKVESSGGKLRLGHISGKLTAETSGGSVSAILPSPVGGRCAPRNFRRQHHRRHPAKRRPHDRRRDQRRQRAERSAGREHETRDDSLRGTINGGGTKLVLRSSAGSINIVSADKETAQQ